MIYFGLKARCDVFCVQSAVKSDQAYRPNGLS